jgi:hypothetical protein
MLQGQGSQAGILDCFVGKSPADLGGSAQLPSTLSSDIFSQQPGFSMVQSSFVFQTHDLERQKELCANLLYFSR